MKLTKYIPFQLLICLSTGILIGHYIHFSLSFVLSFFVFVFVVLIISYFINKKKLKGSFLFTGITYFIFISIGVLTLHFKNDINKTSHYSRFVSSELSPMVLVIKEELKPNDYFMSYYADVIQVDSQKVVGKIKVNLKRDSVLTPLEVGNQIFIKAPVNEIEKPKNPYQFNYKNYLKRQQIYHQVYLTPNEFFQLKKDAKTLASFASRSRKFINKKLKNSGFTGDELDIINALLLGQRKEVSKEIIQNFQKAGALHILALSGLHVGIILWILNFILKPVELIRNGKTLKLVIVVVLLWLFAIIAGLSPSIIRAVTMFTALAIALATHSISNSYRSLAVSAFILLLFNPYYLFEVGFQFSYLAVFFILWLHPIFKKIWNPENKIFKFFWDILTVSVAAQIGVLPLSLYYFHQFPGLFFITNLIVIPLVILLVGLGIFIILLSLIFTLPNFIVEAYEFIIYLLNTFITWVANQESFLFEQISISLFSVLISYFFIVFLFTWFYNSKALYLKMALIMSIIFLGNFLIEKRQVSSTNEFIVFNKSRNSILGVRNGKTLSIHSDLKDSLLENTLVNYTTGSKTKIEETKPLKNLYRLNKNNLLIIDSLGIYSIEDLRVDFILLIQSPKINLERLLLTQKPKIVIADASNYKNLISLWEKTCENHNIKFHYTVRDGAFHIKL